MVRQFGNIGRGCLTIHSLARFLRVLESIWSSRSRCLSFVNSSLDSCYCQEEAQPVLLRGTRGIVFLTNYVGFGGHIGNRNDETRIRGNLFCIDVRSTLSNTARCVPHAPQRAVSTKEGFRYRANCLPGPREPF